MVVMVDDGDDATAACDGDDVGGDGCDAVVMLPATMMLMRMVQRWWSFVMTRIGRES